MNDNMVKVLVVGHTPPPHLGLSLMLDYLVKSEMPGVAIRHVRMELSSDENQVGKVRWMKAVRLVSVLLRVVLARLRYGRQILYYAPAGANRVSMLRDIALLGATRWMFPKTILHYHSSGHCELYKRLPGWQQWLFRRAFFNADGAIRLSELTPDDAHGLQARREFIIHNGMADFAADVPLPCPAEAISAERPLRLLFVALLCEGKGLLVLINACGELARRGIPFRLEVMGRFESVAFDSRTRQLVHDLGIADQVTFLGVLSGQAKLDAFVRTDVLCHPTFYDSFGLVILEAMACRKPVVATNWASIPTMIDEGETGFMVKPHDAAAVADRIATLAADPPLRHRMGKAGRVKFLREFSLKTHLERMRQAFLTVGGQVTGSERSDLAQSSSPLPLEPAPAGN